MASVELGFVAGEEPNPKDVLTLDVSEGDAAAADLPNADALKGEGDPNAEAPKAGVAGVVEPNADARPNALAPNAVFGVSDEELLSFAGVIGGAKGDDAVPSLDPAAGTTDGVAA